MPAHIERNSSPYFRCACWNGKNHALEMPVLFLLTVGRVLSWESAEVEREEPRLGKVSKAMFRDRAVPPTTLNALIRWHVQPCFLGCWNLRAKNGVLVLWANVTKCSSWHLPWETQTIPEKPASCSVQVMVSAIQRETRGDQAKLELSKDSSKRSVRNSVICWLRW